MVQDDRANVQFFYPVAAFAAMLCFELAENPEAFPLPSFFFFPLVCVCVTWAIKSYRSFIVLSIVRSFDGQFKASITFGNEFFTACFVLGCLGLLREYAIAVRFHK